MPARMQFDFSLRPAQAQRKASSAPMRLLLLGDFSALTISAPLPLAERKTLRVDLDNLDDQLQRLAPRLQLPAGELTFNSLDDFHPDRLVARLPVFAALRDLRRRLLDPTSFAQAAAELGQCVVPDEAAAAAPTAKPAPDDDLLANLLGGKPAGLKAAAGAPSAAPSAAPTASSGIDAFIRNMVAPHVVPNIAPQQASYVASIDMAMSETLRAILHAPEFQSLESAWRGVQWLISSLELDESLQLHLFDAKQDELLDDVVAAQGQIENTGTYRALVDRWRNQPGGDGWTAIVCLYNFGPAVQDMGLLAALGVVASQAGGPLLGGGDQALAAAPSDALDGWTMLRQSEVARWIGLAAPRVLLRLPYGKASDPVEAIAFEELRATPDHEQFLWGNGALACALLMGRAFSANGWQFSPGDEREIGDLPAYTVLRDGERELQACAEHYLGDQGGEALLAAGLMPVVSHRHANAVTVMRFQSVAEKATALAGAWGGG